MTLSKRSYDSDQGSQSVGGDSSTFGSENESTRKNSLTDPLFTSSDNDVQAIQLQRKILAKVRKDAYTNGRTDEELIGNTGTEDELGKKLAANRLAASRCRKRKRLYTKGLEDMILQLVKEVYHYKALLNDNKLIDKQSTIDQPSLKRVKQDPSIPVGVNDALQAQLKHPFNMTPPLNSTPMNPLNFQTNQSMTMALNGPIYGTYSNNLISGMTFGQPNGLIPPPSLNCLPAHSSAIPAMTHSLYRTTSGLETSKSL